MGKTPPAQLPVHTPKSKSSSPPSSTIQSSSIKSSNIQSSLSTVSSTNNSLSLSSSSTRPPSTLHSSSLLSSLSTLPSTLNATLSSSSTHPSTLHSSSSPSLSSTSSSHTVQSSSRIPQRLARHHIVRACAKHGQHSAFRSIKKLSLEQFPRNMQMPKLVEMICDVAQWVVRVRVANRTRGGGRGRGKGHCRTRTCTGLVTRMTTDYVTVLVPLHAVRDDIEALYTTADFFCDDNNNNNIITVKGLSLTRHDLHHLAELTCRTNPELGQRFRRSNNKTTVNSVTLAESIDVEFVKNMEGGIAVLISHPHGFSKTVTVGKYCGVELFSQTEGNYSTITASDESRLLLPWRLSQKLQMSAVETETVVSEGKADTHEHNQFSASSSSSSLSSSFQPPTDVCIQKEKMCDDESTSSLVTSVSVKNEAMNTDETTETENSTLQYGLGVVKTVSDEICSLCRSLTKLACRSLGCLGRRVISFHKDVSQKALRVYHSAASCPGSSGGAVLLIGRRVWAELNEAVTSLPVFLHVGVRADQKLGVATPVIVNKNSLFPCWA